MNPEVMTVRAIYKHKECQLAMMGNYVDVSEITKIERVKKMGQYLKTVKATALLAEISADAGVPAYMPQIQNKKKLHLFHVDAVLYFMDDWGFDHEQLPIEWKVRLPIRTEKYDDRLVLRINRSGMIDSHDLITAHGGKFVEWLEHLKKQKTLEAYYKKQTGREFVPAASGAAAAANGAALSTWEELRDMYVKKSRGTYWVDEVIFQNALYYCNVHYQLHVAEIMILYRRDPLKLVSMAVGEYDRQNGVKSTVLISSTDDETVHKERLAKMEAIVESYKAEAEAARLALVATKQEVRLLENDKFTVGMRLGTLDSELAMAARELAILRHENSALHALKAKLGNVDIHEALEAAGSSVAAARKGNNMALAEATAKNELLVMENMELRAKYNELLRSGETARYEMHLETQREVAKEPKEPVKKKKVAVPPCVGDAACRIVVYYGKNITIVNRGEASLARGIHPSTIYTVEGDTADMLAQLAMIIGEHEVVDGAYVYTVGQGDNMIAQNSCEEIFEETFAKSIKKMMKMPLPKRR